jgi:hypothetical protein
MRNKILSLMMTFSVILCVLAFIGFTFSCRGNNNSPANSPSSRYLFEQNFAENNISKIIVEEWGGAYSYIPNIGFSAGKRVIYNGFVQLLDYIIPDSALAVLSNKELQLLRNTIYAKHGMIFQSRDLSTHFQLFSWYNPRNNDVEGRLSEIDRDNIEKIQVFENAQPNHNLSKKNIVGEWWEYFPVPSWTPEIKIDDNNTIEWIGGSEDNFKGSYRIENGFIVVFVTEQYVGTADYFLNNNWRWPNGVTYSNGIVKYNEPIKMVFPVGDTIRFVYDHIMQKRQIGSVVWILVSGDELEKELDSSMQKRAIELARARHRNTDFEEISLIDSDFEMNSEFITVINTYKVLMRGNILGIIGHYIDVTVTGRINLRNDTVQVLEASIR